MRILYIDIDSLRADHLGCYGYGRPVSPVIDAIAARSALFLNCYTSDAPCLPSRAAVFSGRFGIHNGVTCHDGPASQMRYPGRGHTHDPAALLWMRVLQQAGWETVCFSGFGQRHLATWFFIGFTQNFGNQLPGGPETADQVNANVLDWLRANGAQDNWFMHVNYWDVHHPYRAPRAYWDEVARHPLPAHPSAAEIASDAAQWYGPRTARDWWIDGPEWGRATRPGFERMPGHNPDTLAHYADFVNGCDAGLRYVDEHIGQLLAALDQLGIADDTMLIISSDHGESIGELGMYFEHGNACEGTTHVPLIIRLPGVTDAGSRHAGLLYNLDLAPTVLDLIGLPAPERWDGRSVAGAVRGADAEFRPYLVNGAGIFSYQRAVRTERYRLIRTIHSGLYPYDPVYLFDLHQDPGQRHDLSRDRPEVVAELDHLLLEWLWQQTTGPAGSRDPFQEQLAAGFDPDIYCARPYYENRLRALGRDDQLADLRRRRDLRSILRADSPR